MRAVQINTYGGRDVLQLNNNTPIPSLQNGQVLLEIYAASINPFDWKLRSGMFKDMIPLSFPTTLGGDIAGVVKEVSQDVSQLHVGDEVYGQVSVLSGGSGAFAEFAAANTKHLARKPKQTSFEEAASLVLAGVSALQAVEEHIKLQANPSFANPDSIGAKASADAKALADRSAGKQKILIHGGAGGIGSLAIQIAKAIGAHVATTVSSDDREFVRRLGVDEVIDYKTQSFATMLKDYDAVFDTVGGETTNQSFQVLKHGGIIVSMVGQPNEELEKQYGVSAIGQNTVINTKRLERLREYIESGKVKPQVDKVFPLHKVQEAFKHSEEGSPRGKVVLKVKE